MVTALRLALKRLLLESREELRALAPGPPLKAALEEAFLEELAQLHLFQVDR